MKAMSRNDLSKKDFSKIVQLENADSSFQNLLLVVAADSARRRGWKDLREKLMDKCTNPVYQQLWEGWLAHRKQK